MQTWHIHIKGQVQGVGFRPFVSLLAQQLNLKGWVNNGVDGIHIEFNATQQKARDFLETILNKPPILAYITAYKLTEIPYKSLFNFKIIHSQNKGNPNLLLTPDAAICTNCIEELFKSYDRRKTYPFTTCTNCGPRYSIIQSLPYDRQQTTMGVFQMCFNCQKEYQDITNRRYYSQTNSCPACSIKMELFETTNKGTIKALPDLSTSNLLTKIVQLWQAGKIVALKGIGGYLLTCDASNASIVQLLREKKHRPTKAFAVMYPSLEVLKKELVLAKEESELLVSQAAPIVIIRQNKALASLKMSSALASSIAPGLNQIGIMLPYTPFYQLLLKEFGQPIIATSGNSSNSPIIFEDKKAINGLFSIADYIVTNNRKIVVPQDDSVIKFSPFSRQKIVIRRSRGYAPTYIQPNLKYSSKTVLAMGAMLKSTFSLAHQGNIFISQYLGDLENFDTQENYQQTLHHFLQLFQTQPAIVLLDKHQQYASSLYGQTIANQYNVSTIAIQHHEAHFAAILAEHSLIAHKTPILGIIWDGTGLGNDGHIWGGEFFIYQNYQFKRALHLEYVNFILGDKMAREPRISALAYCWGITEAIPYLKEKFTKTEWTIYNKLLERGSTLKTSSIGRLFDAVASLLGILDKQTYEGEAAMLLEEKAFNYYEKNGLNTFFTHYDENKGNFKFSANNFLRILLNDLIQGASTDFIAAYFHFLLVKYIEKVALLQNTKQLAFSGGVFQNGLLVDLLIHHLGDKFDLYFHKSIAPNDENISFGQLMHYHIHLKLSI